MGHERREKPAKKLGRRAKNANTIDELGMQAHAMAGRGSHGGEKQMSADKRATRRNMAEEKRRRGD